jgi:membrane-bound lytic murein transglycosylase A
MKMSKPTNPLHRLPIHETCGLALVSVLALLLFGCPAPLKPPPAPPGAEAPPPMVRIEPSAYPDFSDDLDFEGLEHGISQSIVYLEALPPGREFEFGRDRYTAGHLLLTLQRFQSFVRTRPTGADLQKYIRTFHRVYQSVGRDQKGEVLFTGYYEPLLKGRRSTSPDCRYPIFGRPEDLLSIDLGAFAEKYKGEKLIGRVQNGVVVPYFDRRDIDEAGALYGKAQPLAWVNDPVELFFLHVQGSGRVLLEDGQTLVVGYDTSNGRPYRSIAQLLIEEGRISREEMSMQRIRDYLNQHPGEIQRVLNHNPSYIFFKITPDGPLGSLNVKLTPGRSVALDRRIFPASALTFVTTQKPLSDSMGKITSWVDCRRFMLNQDTGGAITGAGRADLFWGSGPYAELAAGHLKHPGKLYFLVLRPDAASP